MEYSKIIAVTGMPGLFELLNSKADGAIVRSLGDKSSKFVSSRIHNFSHLESIEVFTVRENVNLVDVLKAMEASTEKLPDEKDAAALKKYFSKVYPDLDQDRVYSSDLKKMVKWFSILKSNNIEIKLTEPVQEEEVVVEEVKEEKKAEPAPKKKAAVKEEKVTEEKPVKKPAAKKAAEETKEKKETKKEKPEAEAKPKKAPAKKKSDK
jgi:hypothetical protein